MGDRNNIPRTTTTPAAAHPISAPTDPTPVEQNYLARQVLKAQDRIQEKFPYKASLDAVYWINGAVTICKRTNVRDETAIARILASELWNCTPIQASIDSHLQHHHTTTSSCSTLCLIRFCLKDKSIYTKPTSVITSALARYQKPSEMDVQEHLVAHLQKEEDLLRRRNPDITHESIQADIYGTTISDGVHQTGTCEDSVVARLLDSLRPTEPYLMDHLDKLELLRETPGWTLQSLINAIRSYERKMHESYHNIDHSIDSAVITHYKAKLKSRDSSGIHEYHYFDPTRYSATSHIQSTSSHEPKQQSHPSTSLPGYNIPEQLSAPSLAQTVNRLSTVTESLHKLYSTSTSTQQASPHAEFLRTAPPLSPRKPAKKPRLPSHCLRCGSTTHILYQCKEEDDDKAEQLRLQSEKSTGFRPNPRYRDRGKSLAHTWKWRDTHWPKSWLQPTFFPITGKRMRARAFH